MAEIANSKGTILIVDDEPNVLWFVSKVCQPLGFETLTAGSGMEALKVVQECGAKIDLVLLDLKMPGMGGLEVLRSMRKHQPDIPVVVLTAVHDKEEECRKLGVMHFLKKPYSLEELLDLIKNIAGRRAEDRLPLQLDPSLEPSAKIMIVDEAEEVCELLGMLLTEDVLDAHFEVMWVHSGEEALQKSKDFKPDIAIVEIKMHGIWGDELVRRFKAGEGHCPKDFVIYTASTDPQEVERARRLGHKILAKPTHLEALIEVLKKICVRHELLRPKA